METIYKKRRLSMNYEGLKKLVEQEEMPEFKKNEAR